MNDYSMVTKASLLKNAKEKAIYEINGRRLTFKIVYYDGGIPYGYCASKGIWAHLYPEYMDTEKEGIVISKRISLEKL